MPDESQKPRFTDDEEAQDEQNKPSESSNQEDMEPADEGYQAVPEVEVVDVKRDTAKVIAGHLEGVESSDEKFGDDFWSVLEQAGISKGRFVFFIILVFGAILTLILFLFGGFGIFDFSGEKTSDNAPAVEVVRSDEGAVDTSFVFGEEFSGKASLGSNAGVNAAFIFGESEGGTEEAFVYYFKVLRDLQNSFNTDVYALLDTSVDRRKALDDFIADMESLIMEAEEAREEISLQIGVFENDYDVIGSDQNYYEESFFTAVDNLEGQNSYDFLTLFVEAEQAGAEVRALFNAYQSLYEMYDNALTNVTSRFEDITLNKEAIIDGTRVFDVPGSDIDAIIPLE